MQDYASHFTSAGNGKGIATYSKTNKFQNGGDYIKKEMQISKFTSDTLDVLAVYRSSKGHTVELLQQIKQMINPEKATLITGDFNVCYLNNGNNRLSRGLVEMEKFEQLIRGPTHIMGGHIDHVYWRNVGNMWTDPEIERYSPYYTDHDASCITLIEEVKI